MMEMKDIITVTARQDYKRHFWNAIRLVTNEDEYVRTALGGDANLYLPDESEETFRKLLIENGVIRKLATGLKILNGSTSIYAYDSDDYARH